MKTSEKYPLPTSAECHAKPASLVSVRDLAEFEMVYEAGVDIVDLKEPRSGALAPTDYETWSSVSGFFDGREKQKAGLINGSAPLLSAALGEKKEAFAVAGGLPSIFDFAKAGPSGITNKVQLSDFWNRLRDQLDPDIELVAVAYADWEISHSMHPGEVIELAVAQGFNRFLIDTFTKNGCSSVDYVGLEELIQLRKFASKEGVWFAMAGSVGVSDVKMLNRRGVTPDCYAVRGVVCSQDRSSEICSERLRWWQTFLSDAE